MQAQKEEFQDTKCDRDMHSEPLKVDGENFDLQQYYQGQRQYKLARKFFHMQFQSHLWTIFQRKSNKQKERIVRSLEYFQAVEKVKNQMTKLELLILQLIIDVRVRILKYNPDRIQKIWTQDQLATYKAIESKIEANQEIEFEEIEEKRTFKGFLKSARSWLSGKAEPKPTVRLREKSEKIQQSPYWSNEQNHSETRDQQLQGFIKRVI